MNPNVLLSAPYLAQPSPAGRPSSGGVMNINVLDIAENMSISNIFHSMILHYFTYTLNSFNITLHYFTYIHSMAQYFQHVLKCHLP